MPPNPAPLHLEQPLEIDEARHASRRMAEMRRAAEDLLEDLVKDGADKQRSYRRVYAKAFIAAEGTAAEREAVAHADASQEEFERDIAVGMIKVQGERLRGLEGERSQLKSLIEWSARLRLDERSV